MFDTLLPFFMKQRNNFYRSWEIRKTAKKTAVIYNQPQIFDKLDQINVYSK